MKIADYLYKVFAQIFQNKIQQQYIFNFYKKEN